MYIAIKIIKILFFFNFQRIINKQKNLIYKFCGFKNYRILNKHIYPNVVWIEVSKIDQSIDCSYFDFSYYSSPDYLICDTHFEPFIKEFSSHPKISGFDETQMMKIVRETCVDLFILKKPHHQTSQYNYSINNLQNKSYDNYLRNEIKILDNYFFDYIKTYNSVQTNGYLTQKKKIILRNLDVPRDEILIIIDCLGHPIFYAKCGNHRLRIAQILGLNKVPVIICGISEQWREYCYKNDLSILSEM